MILNPGGEIEVRQIKRKKNNPKVSLLIMPSRDIIWLLVCKGAVVSLNLKQN